ncbi:MAG: phosphatase family protein [Clostridia bacterium]|nr:phosphatase family protein [Clostridia bacterium]
MKINKIKTTPKIGVWNRILHWVLHFQHVFWIICITVSLLLLSVLVPYPVWKKFYDSIIAQRFLVSLGLIFIVIALSLIWTFGQYVDELLFRFINSAGQRAKWLDIVMLCLTQMGNFVFALLVAALFYFNGQRLFAFELIFGLLTLAMIVQSLKVLIHRTRPYNKLKNMRVVGIRDSGHSFPSGHTSQAFFMASLFLHYYKMDGYLGIALYGTAALVGCTRIYVGMHYPRDVIGGAMLGTAWGIIGMFINQHIFKFLELGSI